MEYSDCFRLIETNQPISILCLGHNESKSITFLSVQTKHQGFNFQIGFCPYDSSILEKEELSFVGNFEPNQSLVNWGKNEYRRICEAQKMSDCAFTCKLDQLIPIVLKMIEGRESSYFNGFYNVPFVIPV